MIFQKTQSASRIKRQKWLLLALWAGAAILTACLPQTAQPDDIAIAFLTGDEGAARPRVYIRPAGGVLEAVPTITPGISDFRVLDQGIVVVLKEIQDYRLVDIENIRDGSEQIGIRLEENEKLPLFSSDAARLLTVLPRGPGYGVVARQIQPPLTTENVVLVDTILHPQAWPCSGNVAIFTEPDTGKIYQLDIEERRLSDVTPSFIAGDKADRVAQSCDLRTIAISATGPESEISRLYIYRDGEQVRIIDEENAVEPDVSRDGRDVVFVYGKSKNRILRYNLDTDEISELVRDIGNLSRPQILPKDHK